MLKQEIRKRIDKPEKFTDNDISIYLTKVENLNNLSDIEFLTTLYFKYYDEIIVIEKDSITLAVFGNDGTMLFSNVKY